MDARLSEAFSGVPAPSLSRTFEDELFRRMHPPSPGRLTRKGWCLLLAYALAAAAISVLGSSHIQWNWDWIPQAVVDTALWPAVPLSYLAAIWLQRWKTE